MGKSYIHICAHIHGETEVEGGKFSIKRRLSALWKFFNNHFHFPAHQQNLNIIGNVQQKLTEADVNVMILLLSPFKLTGSLLSLVSKWIESHRKWI